MKKLVSHFVAIFGVSLLSICPLLAQEPQYTIEEIATYPYRYANGVQASSINNRGQVCGTIELRISRQYYSRAFLWSKNSGMLDLGAYPYGARSQASSVNDHSEVTGSAQAVNQIWRAFTWSLYNGMQEINIGGGESHTVSINNLGFYAGNTLSLSNWQAFFGYDDADISTTYLVPYFVNNGGNYAYCINDLNYVVGSSNYVFGSSRIAHPNSI